MLNGNKFFWGVTMLLLNFGSRYIIGDLGKIHDRILGNEIVKKIITFSLFFVATRDIITAFILTVAYVIIVDGLLHEKRKFCILPEKYRNLPDISDDEYKRARDIVQRYEGGATTTTPTQASNEKPKKIFELYKEAVLLL